MGRQQFSQPINVVAQTSQSSVMTELTSATVLPVTTGVEHMFVYAPVGSIAELNSVFLLYPAVVAATSGTKTMTIGLAAGAGIISTLQTGNWNTDLKLDVSQSSGHTLYTPDTRDSFLHALRGLIFNATNGLWLSFYNNTNGATAETRVIRISSKRTAVS